MSNLSEIYSKIKNPMSNKDLIKKLIGEYETVPRGDSTLVEHMYNRILKLNGNRDNSQSSFEDMQNFYVKTYNQWKNKLMSLTPQQIEQQKKNGVDIEELRDYMTKFGKIRTMKDVIRLSQNPLFNNPINGWAYPMNGWEFEEHWMHIKSRYINVRQESSIDVKHRLYLGCQNQDIYKMMDLFKSKCEEQGIPYYFKTTFDKKRDDKIVIYSDTQNLSKYLDVLREIARENPEIVNRSGKPPALTGKIDGWIGIGDEPPRDDKGAHQSFNQVRARVIEDSIEEELLISIITSLRKDVVYGGKSISFNDLFIKTATQQLIDILKKHNDERLKSEGLVREDLTNEKSKDYLQYQLKLQIKNGLKALWEVKDDNKYTKAASNCEAIFNIPTRNGCSVKVCFYVMDSIIKSMLPIIQEIEPNFVENVSKKIEEKSMQQGIDSQTFCFNKGTKEKFEQISGKTVKSSTGKKAGDFR